MTIDLTWDEMADLDPVPTEVPGGVCDACGDDGPLVCPECDELTTFCTEHVAHEVHVLEEDPQGRDRYIDCY